ncbi:MAG: helix-turn-helix domain-containing protein, partial [bacterium]
MENIGIQLKEKREHLNKSLEEIHDLTRIAITHLQFLENNEFTFLPETYVKSFLKTYAEALELDADDIVNKYLENQQEKKREEEEAATAAAVESRIPDTKNQILEWALGIGAVVLVISLIFVYIQYRAQIYARPIQQMELAPAMESTPLADKLILPTATDNIKNRVAPIELQIKANDKVWIQFTVDDKTVSKYFLSPEEHLIWTAENNFDILFANTGEIRFT